MSRRLKSQAGPEARRSRLEVRDQPSPGDPPGVIWSSGERKRAKRMSKKPRRTNRATENEPHYAYPGLNLRPLAKGSDAPLSARARAAYLVLVGVLIAAFVIALIWMRANN